MKKRMLLLLATLFAMTYIGCGNSAEWQGQTDETGGFMVESPIWEKSDEGVELGRTFKSPFVEGNLYYTVSHTGIYQNLEEAGISMEEVIMPYNTYGSQELWGEYMEVSDYIDEKGEVTETHCLVVLDIHVENEDAVGMFKKNNFAINSLCLYGGDPVTQYYPAYFSEAGKVEPEQPFHYVLEQGQEMDVRLAYLILEEDLQDLEGKVSDSETEFSIYE